MATFTQVILYTDSDGVARFREEAIPLSEGSPKAQLSAPRPASALQLRMSPVGFRSDFHCTTTPQWLFVLSGRMEIMLRGKESLMAHLPLPFAREIQAASAKQDASSAYEKRSGSGEYDTSEGEALLYTGIVIDARHLDYRPSLNTGIYTGSGRQIYGVEYLNRNTAVKRGVAGHYAAESDAELRQRAGKRPLKVSALDLNGHGENSLVISDEDAAKLLAHAGSVQNLRRGRVVVLVNAAKLKEKY